jgi:hypothetical protein
MNEQTAVEFLVEWMKDNVAEYTGDMEKAIIQALDMENYQLNDAFFRGVKAQVLNKSPYNK